MERSGILWNNLGWRKTDSLSANYPYTRFSQPRPPSPRFRPLLNFARF